MVVPEGIDDATRPSGGNVYDRRVCAGLAAAGWVVGEHAVPGDWPHPDAAALDALAAALDGLPHRAVVLLDGLIACAAGEALRTRVGRLRMVVLVHAPPDDASALVAATAVVTTSAWTRRLLLERHGLSAGRVYVARPGVDPAPEARGGDGAGALLCVAAVHPGKGHDVLLDALARVADLDWHCTCVGSVRRDPVFVSSLLRQAERLGLTGRVTLTGARTGADLEADYASADLLLLASRAETYGMVVTEALARGVPVLATRVGGLAEAMGFGADGTRPGMLVPADDPVALGEALRGWLCDPPMRARLRRAARERRGSLAGWPATVAVLDRVLDGVRR